LQGAEVGIKVNKINSVKTQLPYNYYSLYQQCTPDDIVNSAENLGEVLLGDRIENSKYNFNMREEKNCQNVCSSTLDAKSAKLYEDRIRNEYRVNMILDNLPIAMVKMREEDGQLIKGYERGFPVGFLAKVQGRPDAASFINNHLRFTILYHRDAETDLSRIVGFEVDPFSVAATKDGNPGCSDETLMLSGKAPQMVKTNEVIHFTYDVRFVVSNVRWASRWDTYLLMMDDQIHWFSIINSVMIVLFLSGMVAMIMMRTLHRDISRYNQLEAPEETAEETGWKMVHGDVFRPPPLPSTLAAYCGSGVQIFGMALTTMVFAVLGFLSPANRGGLLTAMLLLFVFMGLFAGYFSARLYKTLKGESWKTNTMQTALMFPGVCFGVFFVLNLFIWGEKSSGAVPFGTLFALCFLWFGISVPLVFLGSYFGVKRPAYEDPVRTNMIPRQIPEQAWYMKPLVSILVGGVLPFGAVFIELFFILTSMWLHQFYYIFGFLFVVFIILIITCAEISIVLCYFQLCTEDYRWWWRSFFTSGSSALYLFLYSAFYFYTKLEITKFTSGLMYFGYMSVLSYGFFVFTGTIGFYSCYLFVRAIYGSVKID
jgi:transmembrane 9 superfamily protein 2/4